RAHHACMPEPFIDTLTIQLSYGLAPLLGIRPELLLERCELCKGRIGVRHLVAPGAAVAAAPDVFRPQRRIALGTVATLGAIGGQRRGRLGRRCGPGGGWSLSIATAAVAAAPGFRRPLRRALASRPLRPARAPGLDDLRLLRRSSRWRGRVNRLGSTLDRLDS